MNEDEGRKLRQRIRDILDDYADEPVLCVLGIPTGEAVLSTLHATGMNMHEMAEIIGIQLGQVLYDNLDGLTHKERLHMLMALADEIKEVIKVAVTMKHVGIHLNEGARNNDRRNPAPF